MRALSCRLSLMKFITRTALACGLILTGIVAAQTHPATGSATPPPVRQYDFPPGGCPAYGALAEPLRTLAASPAQVFPSQPASGDRPAFPATLSIARTPCGLNVAEAELRLTFTADAGVQVERPRINIVQRGIDYGCAGIPWTGRPGEVNAGECAEFAWYEPPRFCTGMGFVCPTPASLARMPFGPVTNTLYSRKVTTSFDPDLPFTLRVRGNWPASAPDLVYEVAGRGVNFDVSMLPADITGQWWNPAEPGWALLVDRNWRGAVNAVWLTYDDAGNSTWFMMLNGLPVEPGIVEGDVYATRGRPFTQFGESAALTREAVGRFRISFSAERVGEFRYTVNGRTGARPIERFEVRSRTGQVCSHLRGLMLTGIDGWGASVDGDPTRADCGVHATLLTYDDAGQPFWVFGGLLPQINRITHDSSSLSGDLYRPRGTPYGLNWDPGRFSIGAPAGNWRSQFFVPSDPFQRVAVVVNSIGRELSFERFRFEY